MLKATISRASLKHRIKKLCYHSDQSINKVFCIAYNCQMERGLVWFGFMAYQPL